MTSTRELASGLRRWQEKLERVQQDTEDAIATCDKGEAEAKQYFADSRDFTERMHLDKLESIRRGR